jgi:L-rhamnose mutarotase
MERLCFLMHLVPGAEAEYDRRHDTLWPDMREALVAAGYTNYSLFRRGTEVIGYAECVPDIATVQTKMGAAEVNARWGESFGSVIAPITDENGDLINYPEVWHLDESA